MPPPQDGDVWLACVEADGGVWRGQGHDRVHLCGQQTCGKAVSDL